MKLTDVNGKQFTLDLSELTDMKTVLPDTFSGEVADFTGTRPDVFTPQIVDSAGRVYDATASEQTPKAIEVTFEATHSGKNLNHFQYDSEVLEAAAETWMSPYPCPLIKNHNMHEEPLGRVSRVSFEPSQFNDQLDTIAVTFRVTDKQAVERFLDGRYRTMSIGANVNTVKCNICGKTLLKDGEFKFCGHMKGQRYGAEKAYWTAGGIEYKEGSVVNSPADVYAQVRKIEVLTEEGGKSMKDDNKTEETPVLDDAALLDTLLTDSEEPIVSTITDDEGQVESDEKATDDNEAGEDEIVTDERDEQITALQDEVSALKDEVQALTDENQALKDENQTLADRVTALEAEADTSASDMAEARQRNVRLASMNKALMADRVADMELYAGTLTDEARDERLNELLALTAAELKDAITTTMATTTTIRQMAVTVENPANVSDTVTSTTVKNAAQLESSVTDVPKKTFKDLEDSFVNLLFRNY